MVLCVHCHDPKFVRGEQNISSLRRDLTRLSVSIIASLIFLPSLLLGHIFPSLHDTRLGLNWLYLSKCFYLNLVHWFLKLQGQKTYFFVSLVAPSFLESKILGILYQSFKEKRGYKLRQRWKPDKPIKWYPFTLNLLPPQVLPTWWSPTVRSSWFLDFFKNRSQSIGIHWIISSFLYVFIPFQLLWCPNDT